MIRAEGVESRRFITVMSHHIENKPSEQRRGGAPWGVREVFCGVCGWSWFYFWEIINKLGGLVWLWCWFWLVGVLVGV